MCLWERCLIMNKSNTANYKPKDFAELLGVSVKTLQRWDREGIWKANRTPTNLTFMTNIYNLKKYIQWYKRYCYKCESVYKKPERRFKKPDWFFKAVLQRKRKYKKLWRIKFPVKTDLYALAMILLKSSAKNSIIESLLQIMNLFRQTKNWCRISYLSYMCSVVDCMD